MAKKGRKLPKLPKMPKTTSAVAKQLQKVKAKLDEADSEAKRWRSVAALYRARRSALLKKLSGR